MSADNGIEKALVEAVSAFLADEMSMTPTSVSVDVHPDSIVVTFRGATSQGEKACARDLQARERIERCYRKLFQFTAPSLNATVGPIAGRPVEQSRLSLDVVAGDGVILFTCRKQAYE